jgi:Holliday junction DNA helicase RuvA
MIASLRGTLEDIGRDHIVVAVHGVGFKVFVPFGVINAGIGDEITLQTLLIVREDALALYGFPSKAEREYFEHLISVTGVGPKLALSILSVMSIDRLHSAVAAGQVEAFTHVPGIGKKTAEKIIFELKDKLTGADGLAAVALASEADKDVLDALVSLGYSAAEAQAALRSIPPSTPQNFEERMRRALQYFA